ncbi:type 4 prepilin peptidase 1 [Thiogranum longum]|uniref:Prepilin leader peptidase/N-methyltransferase n=1 Tax=Thiogranum longum TaxID=1537524 RepID=A0A4R1HA15_9GAMM|nr:A24 family peptidase [Thiogranum longum]TCK17333.1 type 4 prepilin peptidase 1 [Thiogranum longum]
MELISLLENNFAFFIATVFVLGLVIGSFLNVVIYRLPVMMEREWKTQAREYMGEDGAADEDEPLSLSRPASRCPSCNHKIHFYENIPVVSYLLLRGKCSSCKTAISLRYPLVELMTGVLSAVVAWHFGFGWQAGAALLLTWALIALSMIDIDHQLLPDSITLPFLWLGLLLSLFPVFADMRDSLIGAIAGYLSLWTVYQVFKLVTGKEGMGYGDFKLLALLGAWMGWQALPMIVLLSSAVGAVLGGAMILIQGRDRAQPIPFGPYLAIAGWIALLWGDRISHAYLRWSGMA